MTRALVIAIGALLLVPAAASAKELARVSAPSPVSAYDGRALWSARDPSTGRYQLMTWVAGTTYAVGVPTRSVPFDADLGPDANGKTVAVYSRCARDPVAEGRSSFGVVLWGSGRGCDIYEYEFVEGRERKLNGPSSADSSEFLPSVWHGEIAFARTYDDKRAFPYLYVKSLSGGSSRRQPGGPRNACQPGYCSDNSALEAHERRPLRRARGLHVGVRGPGRDVHRGNPPRHRRRARTSSLTRAAGEA